MGLEFIREQQRSCADRYIEDGHPGAELGMGDWFAEEFLMLQTPPPPKEIKGGGVEGKEERTTMSIHEELIASIQRADEAARAKEYRRLLLVLEHATFKAALLSKEVACGHK